MHDAITDFMQDVKGSFAILLAIKGDKNLYALKRNSPLVLGIGGECNILASDPYAFNTSTDKVVFFDDNEFAIVGENSFVIYDHYKEPLEKEITNIETRKEENKKEYPHFMIKEIEEQPLCAKRLIESFDTSQKKEIEKFSDLLKTKKKVVFIACGTSYHASLVGVSLFKQAGIHAQSIVASEWEHFIEADEKTFVIAISQSGETMDVVVPLKEAKKKGATIGAIVNVPHSTIQRISDISLNILAGQEIAVASTKAFTNTLITLLQLARKAGVNFDISKIPSKLSETLNTRKTCRKVAQELKSKKDVYILGKHFSYPVAREIGLKLKEVDYIHAEGMMAGEIKHGTLALIEEGVPVICLMPKEDKSMKASIEEVKARGATTYTIANNKQATMQIPDCSSIDFPIYATLVGHLLSYELGVLLGREIDQCRNLAKSVTVT